MKTLKEYAAIVNERLNELMPEMPDGEFENGGRPWLVNNAMRYSLVAGGKRLLDLGDVVSRFLKGNIGQIALTVRAFGILEPLAHVALTTVIGGKDGMPIIIKGAVKIG